MFLMLSLDNLASRYGLLPSEALARATTFDLTVLDISAKWENYQRAKAENGGRPPTPELTQDQMMDMINRVKGQPQ